MCAACFVSIVLHVVFMVVLYILCISVTRVLFDVYVLCVVYSVMYFVLHFVCVLCIVLFWVVCVF